MAFSYRDLFCGGKTFCCCLPVRMGVIIMSLLGVLFGGFLSIVLWFEVANTAMSRGEKAAFAVAGLVETFLFTASVLGFVGAVVRKQLFVQIYAYFIYIHFVLNIAIAAYLLYVVTHVSANATVKACQDTIRNVQAQEQCTGLLAFARGVYFAITSAVLLIELYGVLVVARYVNQVKGEKSIARASRMMARESGIKLLPGGHRYLSLQDGQDRRLLNTSTGYPLNALRDFDPYEEIAGTSYGAGPSHSYSGVPALPVEVGYGGGSWTHEDISQEEKVRLKKRDDELGLTQSQPEVDDEEAEWKKEKIKSPFGLTPTVSTGDTDVLPRYTLSDPPVAWSHDGGLR